MRTLIRLSLVINLLVLLPICAGLITGADWPVRAYGDDTPARGILLAIYLAILVTSALLLRRPEPGFVAALLFVQVIYKVLTPFTVGTVLNPVVVSNLLIAAVHTVTLVAIWRGGGTASSLRGR